MRRNFLVSCVLSLAVLIKPYDSFAQSHFVNDLIGAMVAAGFDLSEVDKLRMAKLLSDNRIINCQIKKWGEEVDASSLTQTERYRYLEECVKQFDTKLNLVSKKLSTIVGENQQAKDLARSIARDNDMDTILDEVLPKLQSMVDKVKSDLQDEIDLVRIISSEYRQKFDSLCKKVQSIDQRLNALEEQQRQAFRPPLPDPTDASILKQQPQPNQQQLNQRQDGQHQNNQSGVIYPDRIVSDKSVLCSQATMIRKCYDFTPLEEVNGRLVQRFYHGDLYHDCDGYILVTHVKTSNRGTIVNYPTYTYQTNSSFPSNNSVRMIPNQSPTQAPPLNSVVR